MKYQKFFFVLNHELKLFENHDVQFIDNVIFQIDSNLNDENVNIVTMNDDTNKTMSNLNDMNVNIVMMNENTKKTMNDTNMYLLLIVLNYFKIEMIDQYFFYK